MHSSLPLPRQSVAHSLPASFICCAALVAVELPRAHCALMRVSHALCMRPVTVVLRRSDNATAHGGVKDAGAGSGACATSATSASNQDSGANHKRRRRTNASTDADDAQRRREFESGCSDRMAEPSSSSSSADAEDVDYFCRFCGVNVSPHDTCSLISVRFEGADIPFTCVENAPSCLDLTLSACTVAVENI
jgi:hypothetical protein